MNPVSFIGNFIHVIIGTKWERWSFIFEPCVSRGVSTLSYRFIGLPIAGSKSV